MKTSFKLSIALAAAALVMTGGAQAQSNTSASGGYSTYAPGGAYIGLNAGLSNYRLNNGEGNFLADQRKNSYSIQGGGYFNQNFGIGAEYMFSSNVSAVLQYDEYRLKFAGQGNDKIATTSLGIRYNF
jgi:hypothetical protein